MVQKATGRATFSKYKAIINFLIFIIGIFPNGINRIFLVWNRNTSGHVGLLIRYVLVRNLAQRCGDNVSIQPGAYLFNLKNMSIGNNVSIHPMCYLDAAGGIVIGDDVSIAHNTSIMSTNHTWENKELPIKYNTEDFAEVTIHNDVWIGCGVRILAGVTVHSRSIVAAGAVVTKDVEGHTIVGGIPAKILKTC